MNLLQRARDYFKISVDPWRTPTDVDADASINDMSHTDFLSMLDELLPNYVIERVASTLAAKEDILRVDKGLIVQAKFCNSVAKLFRLAD